MSLIDIQLNFVKEQILSQNDSQSPQACKLKWTGSIVEWVELIYALYLVKRINDGRITLTELFCHLGKIFDFEVKEFTNYFMNIKNRTDGKRTKFTDLMKESLTGRMIESDKKPARK